MTSSSKPQQSVLIYLGFSTASLDAVRIMNTDEFYKSHANYI